MSSVAEQVAEIPLTKGEVALVDWPDALRLTQYRWVCQSYRNGKKYASRSEGGRTILMHRQILGLQPGDGLLVDHADDNGLNNVRSNIRICTSSANQFNKAPLCNKSSKYKGVRAARDRWMSMTTVNGEQKYLGCYDTEVEAAFSYNIACKEWHGDFFRPNEIDPAELLSALQAQVEKLRGSVDEAEQRLELARRWYGTA